MNAWSESRPCYSPSSNLVLAKVLAQRALNGGTDAEHSAANVTAMLDACVNSELAYPVQIRTNTITVDGHVVHVHREWVVAALFTLIGMLLGCGCFRCCCAKRNAAEKVSIYGDSAYTING